MSYHDRTITSLYHRQRRLPAAIEAAERKLIGLYREATRYRMDDDILSDTGAVGEAIDRETLMAILERREAARAA